MVALNSQLMCAGIQKLQLHQQINPLINCSCPWGRLMTDANTKGLFSSSHLTLPLSLSFPSWLCRLTQQIGELLMTAGLIWTNDKVQTCNTVDAVQKIMNNKADAHHICQLICVYKLNEINIFTIAFNCSYCVAFISTYFTTFMWK